MVVAAAGEFLWPGEIVEVLETTQVFNSTLSSKDKLAFFFSRYTGPVNRDYR